MKLKKFVLFFIPLIFSAVTVFAAESSIHDFTFGLSDEFPALEPYREGEDGNTVFRRFEQQRSELPDELSVFEPYEVTGKVQIFIATDGDDSAKGTIDSPFKSFKRAFEEVGRLKNHDGGIVIYVRGGIYSVSEGIEVPDYISGSEDNPLIISAYPGETVNITGGISISGDRFSPVTKEDEAYVRLPETAKGNVYSANLKELGYTEYPSVTTEGAPSLTAGGLTYTLARWPNSTTVKYANYMGADGKDGVIDIGPILTTIGHAAYTGDTGKGFEFQILDTRPFNWRNTGNIWMNGQFDEEWMVEYYKIKSFNTEKKSIRTYTPTTWGARYNAHHSYYYLNVFEELDVPGEFFLDSETGILYVYPMTNLNDTIVSIAHTKDNLMTFSPTSHNIVLNGITFSDSLGAAVVLSGYRNVMQNCTVSDVQGDGANICEAKNSGVINSIFKNCNLRSSNTYGGTTVFTDSQALRPTRNFIQNNTVINGQIILRYGVQNIISHNSVQNAEKMCIYIAQTQESIIEFNEVVGGPHRTLDSGCIYHEGLRDNTHNHIRYNYIHDGSIKIRQSPFGIYLDDLSSSSYVYGNIVQQAICFAHGGSHNVFYNNIMLDNDVSRSSVTNSDNYYVGNVVYFKFGTRAPTGKAVAFDFDNVTNFKSTQITWKNRFPELYSFMRKLSDNNMYHIINGDTYTDYDADFIAPINCAYVNNLIYNAPPVTGENSYERGALIKDNYTVPKDKNVFEDYTARKYDIADINYVRQHIPTFEVLPRQERMGVLTNSAKADMTEILPLSPAMTGDKPIMFNDVIFSWTKCDAATYYDFTLAEDPEFEKIIVSDRVKYNSYSLSEDLDFEKTYYWKITADSLSQCVKNNHIVMDTAMFKTCSYAEAVAMTEMDLSDIEAKIKDIQDIQNIIIEDTGEDIGVGVYRQGTKAAVDKLIEEIRADGQKCELQRDADGLAAEIDARISDLLTEYAIPYTRKYTDMTAADWKICEESTAFFKFTPEEVTFKSLEGYNILHDARILTPKETVNMMVNFGEMKQWDAFGVKQTVVANSKNILRAEGYFVVVKTDFIELQKYPANGTAILCAVENNNAIKPNTYHNIESLCENTAEGVHVLFKVDGKAVIDYIDTENPIKALGYVSKQANFNANSGVYFKTVR